MKATRILASALAAAALAAPTALAAHAPGDAATFRVTNPAPAPVQIVKVVKPSGFSIRDFGIGLAAAIASCALGAATLVLRRRDGVAGAPAQNL